MSLIWPSSSVDATSGNSIGALSKITSGLAFLLSTFMSKSNVCKLSGNLGENNFGFRIIDHSIQSSTPSKRLPHTMCMFMHVE